MEGMLSIQLAKEIEMEKKRQARAAWLKGMAYVLPSLTLFTLFVFYPFMRTIAQSVFLSDTTGNLTVFAALDNYIDLFRNPIYQKSLWRTFLYMAMTVPFSVIISLLLAVLAGGKQKGMGIYRTIFSSTMGISVAAGSMFWNFLFHPTLGLLNHLIKLFGFEPIGWFTTSNYALIAISVVTVWMNLGFSFLVLSGGLKNIDPAYYESADIVGGGFWYRLKRITVPLLSPSLFFVVMISIINAFQSFGVIDMLTQGGPMNSTRLLVYGLYQDAFMNYQYGQASAQGVILFAIIFLISMMQMKLTEKWVTYQ